MKSLLGALQAGRLVELHSTDKETDLRALAHLIEAVPEMSREVDLVNEVLQRERVVNSGIGLGVACPHVRVGGSGDLLCSVGWSPAGIDYGAADGRKVHLVAMYFIPDVQKNAYLKEISSLAGAIQKAGDIQAIAKAEDVAAVREQLLGWVSSSVDSGASQIRARMIHLEAKQSQGTAVAAGAMIPVLAVSVAEKQTYFICANRDLSAALEKDPSAAAAARQGNGFDRAGYRFLHRSPILYDPARPVHEYVAVKLA